MILNEEELIIHLTEKNKLYQIDLSNKQKIEVFIEDIPSFLNLIESRKEKKEEFDHFGNVSDLSIFTFIQKEVKFENVLDLIQLIVGNDQVLDRFTLSVGLHNQHRQKFKYYTYKVSNDLYSLELSQQLINKLKVSKLIKLEFLNYSKLYDCYICTSNKDTSKSLNLLLNIQNDLYSYTQSNVEILKGYQGTTHLRINFNHQTTLTDISIYFKFQIACLKSLRVLKLKMSHKLYINNTEQEYTQKQVLVRSFMQLPFLEELYLRIGKNFTCVLFQQFNEIESAILEESNIQTFSFHIEDDNGKKRMKSINFAFLRYLNNLLHLRLDSKIYEVENLDKALPALKNLCSLQLQQININEESLLLLGQSFRNLRNLKRLQFSCFCINPPSISSNSLPQDLHNLSSLQELDICITQSYELNEEGLRYLNQSFSGLKQLNQLRLILENQKINNQKFTDFCLALKEVQQLKKLKLSFEDENHFGDEGMSQLSQSLALFTKVDHLSLTLSSNQITRRGTLELQTAIKSLSQKPYVYLHVTDYETLILQHLKKTDSQLIPLVKRKQFLNFYNNNYSAPYCYTFTFIHATQKYTSDCLSSEEKERILMKIHSNQYLTSAGLKGIFQALYPLQNLQMFYLQLEYNQIGIEGIYQISKLITRFSQLKELCLHLQAISISKEGINTLYSSIKTLSDLIYLSILQNEYQEIDEENNIFKYLKNLKYLRLKNKIGIEKTFEEISQMQSLRFLMLTHNSTFTVEQYKKYFTQLTQLKKLPQLNLYIDLNFDKNHIKQQSEQFYELISTFDNLTSFTFSVTGNTNEIYQKAVTEIRRIKRLVTFKNIYNIHRA